MNNKKPYIERGENGINFYYEFSLLDYLDIPIVFICSDEASNLYLCNCTEFRFGKQLWTIAKTSFNVIESLLDSKITVYTALNYTNGLVYIAECDLSTNVFKQDIVKFESLPDNRLPKKDSFLKSIGYDTMTEYFRMKKRMTNHVVIGFRTKIEEDEEKKNATN